MKEEWIETNERYIITFDLGDKFIDHVNFRNVVFNMTSRQISFSNIIIELIPL